MLSQHLHAVAAMFGHVTLVQEGAAQLHQMQSRSPSSTAASLLAHGPKLVRPAWLEVFGFALLVASREWHVLMLRRAAWHMC